MISLVTITVCIGSSCHLKGSYDVVSGFQRLIKENNLEDEIVLKAAFCLGECTSAVSVKVNDGKVLSVNKTNIDSFFDEFILKEQNLALI